MTIRKSDLIIVGGGTGGIVLALVLARKGFRISILDRQNPPIPAPRGEILQPNGLKILEQLDVLSELLAADIHRCDRVNFYKGSGDHLCTINYTRLPSPYAYALILLPEVLQKLLLDRLEAEPQIQTFWGTSFKNVIWKDDQILGVLANDSEKDVSFHAPVVVGADGAASRVRDAFQISPQLYSYADGYVTMVVDRPAGFQKNVNYYLGKEMIFGAFPVSTNRIYLFYLVPTDRLQEVQSKSVDHLKREVLSLNPEINALFSLPLKEVSSWEKCAYMRCFRVKSPSWVVNGGALLGDAAHAMNPHVAQGRNSAMEDALALSSVIEDCFEKGIFSKEMLKTYETARRKNVDSLQRIGHEMAWLWNNGSAPVIWARERVFRSVHAQGVLHDKMLNTVSGLKISPLNLADRCRALFPEQTTAV